MAGKPLKTARGKKTDKAPEPEARTGGDGTDLLHHPGVPSLIAAPLPLPEAQELSPQQQEFYVRSAMHQDRSPGNLLVVVHPWKRRKFPSRILEDLATAGFRVTTVETQEDRVRSVEGIRDRLVALAREPAPLDLLTVSGDGTLDNHVLVAAYLAFYPDLVRHRPGCIDLSGVSEKELAVLPEAYRKTFFDPLPDTGSLDPDDRTVKEIWLLRSRLDGVLARRRSVSRVLKRSGRRAEDPVLRTAVLAGLFPERVVLRPHGFDLAGLAGASRDRTFQGLYPFVRSLSLYPAGTAADNAVFAGVPGWTYATVEGLLHRSYVLRPLRRLLERRVERSFLRYFLRGSTVVPARVSIVGFDRDWQRISSHVAGGPAAGHFFAQDLTAKTRGLAGYLKRIPRAVVLEGILGKTIVRIRSRFASGREKSFAEARIAEALYTNRTFIAGVGSVPTTNPTSFAGQSSLLLIPPIWTRTPAGRRVLSLRGLLTLGEAIVKGLLGRFLHASRLGVGTLAGGGKFFFLLPGHQVAIKEGESIEVEYLTLEKRPRAIAIQASGEPFQAWRLDIRVAWGPVPLLARSDSLLMTAARRSLTDLRVQQTYQLRRVYIGGVRHFLHHVGEDWTPEFVTRCGLFQPLLHLPRSLVEIQRMLLTEWQALGTGAFVDTTESGLEPLRRGRYAHNNDQSAHLIVLRDARDTLLVRQVRAVGANGGAIYETRSSYRWLGGSYLLFRSETVIWRGREHPRILQENHLFRSAEGFQREAPTFFPVVARSPESRTLLDLEPAEPGAARAEPGPGAGKPAGDAP